MLNKAYSVFFKIRESSTLVQSLESILLTDSLKEKMFASMQKLRYAHGTSDHSEHDGNPDYNKILLKHVKLKAKDGKVSALDFGCGQGRNIHNIWNLDSNIVAVDGVDISEANCEFCKKRFAGKNTKIFNNAGSDATVLPRNVYDFAMSTVVFQHIPVFSIRDRLIKDIFNSLKPGGVFSVQMGYGADLAEINGTGQRFSYDSNNTGVANTNGTRDVRITSPSQITDHFKSIGFEIIEYEIAQAWADNGHPNWIYVHAKKP